MVAVGSSFGPALAGRTVTVWVVGPTAAPFQASNERVMVAVPGPASSRARTGPSKLTPQHLPLMTHFSLRGGAPAFAAGSEMSATGLAVSGTVSW